MGSTTLAWSINNTVVNENYNTENFYCITTVNTLTFLTVLVAVVGLVGNAIVIWLLGFHIHRNAFSVYVLNLAGADFLYLCTQSVYFLECILQLGIRHLEFLPIVLIFAYLAGMSMIAAISAERCLSVMRPIWYHCQRPRHLSAILCALLWAFSLLLSVMLELVCSFLPSHYKYSFCRTCSFITAAFIIVLFVVISVSSLALLVKIICGSHRIPVTRFFVTVTLTVVVFIFFGLPFGISWFLLWWIREFQRIVFYEIDEIVTFLSCVNSCANPIIYFLIGSIRHRRLQWQTLKLLLQRAMQDTPEEESGERHPSQRSGEPETVCYSSQVSP
ncbi:mas-related G-protein coupled receptor member B4-like [Arvicanthis niloticus]|uniref:mas-related G-protein coupled receptor member B4-like n=1 Tax=Arvicanthis niloticus TaxID=61156 RepID=UPI0014871002|nr:mas-related G-protein coupled receptor member B4-like [Arvicanthis niloticus]